MSRFLLFLFVAALAGTRLLAAEVSIVDPAHRITADDPGWLQLMEDIARHGPAVTDFTEKRVFPFRLRAVTLKGVARLSPDHGLSLEYLDPVQRVVIFDEKGLLIREDGKSQASIDDARAVAAQKVLAKVLRLDLGALGADFEMYGVRSGDGWTLVLVPRTDALRQTVGEIVLSGDTDVLQRIELRRSSRQYIEITLDPPRQVKSFTADELQRYFR